MKCSQTKYLSAILCIILCISIFSACGKSKINELPESSNTTSETAVSVEFTDAFGNNVKIESADRVASVLGSFAEAWTLAGGELVGVTDDAVKERGLELKPDVALLGGTKDPSLETILSLNPDFVIVSSDISGHENLYNALRQSDIPVAAFHVDTLDDYIDMMKIFTDITGRSDLFEKNALDVKQRAQKIIDSIPNTHPTALYIRAFSSGYKVKSSDSLTGEILSDLGVINIADNNASLLEDLSLEAIIAQDPDYIFVTTMGSDEEKALSLLEDQLCSNPAWANLSAVKNDNFHILPKNLFHYKPNAQWAESYEYLAGLLYGKQ